MIGSGIYWILSSELIASFTVLTPQAFSSNPTGTTLVLVIGVLSSSAGLWIIRDDLNQLTALVNRGDGWLYLTPLFLSSGDLAITLIGLSYSRTVMELNPLVASAVQGGPSLFAAFTISYMTLSAGLTLLMLHMGRLLFPAGPWSFLALAVICGVASFGLLNNLLVLAIPSLQGFSLFGSSVGAVLVVIMTFKRLVKGEWADFRSAMFPTP